MRPETLGLIIGGVVPALLFSVSNLSSKGAVNAGISMGPYVLLIGIGVTIIGVLAMYVFPERVINPQSAGIALLFGLSWGIGVGCVAFAIAQYGSNISQLAPLFNVNTLFTVLIALWIFSEWGQVQVPQLLLGSLMIVAGSVLVARA
jgi:drug/metabolite transporter (DMT)-like permease